MVANVGQSYWGCGIFQRRQLSWLVTPELASSSSVIPANLRLPLLLNRHYRSHARLRVVLPFHSVGHGGQFGEEAFGDEFLQTGWRLAACGFELVDGAVHLHQAGTDNGLVAAFVYRAQIIHRRRHGIA